MRTIMEVLFNSIYLISVVTIGLVMIMKSEENKQFKLFGLIMATQLVG
ncbi:hypothetical protein J2Z44_003020 [Clostridium punense]|uniref:Uncharacterized protein n=1 Tax=Clostridium punense TaxID=1054297 RepID=A0ABS4K5Y1_9CLOT|nr:MULTISPECIES: hypothetical protein [Clostridium]EQB87312.1 hypothetical protein M918_09730 [Clostridium sp. BL8]MBP2023185.1 hypothetical protein [Clostridium punense]